MTQATLFDFSSMSIAGKPADFAARRGHVFLIVNTASACGFTPQFKGLEALWQDYCERGLVVVGYPCNQFGAQDSGSNGEIASFCEVNYGVSFPMMSCQGRRGVTLICSRVPISLSRTTAIEGSIIVTSISTIASTAGT